MRELIVCVHHAHMSAERSSFLKLYPTFYRRSGCIFISAPGSVRRVNDLIAQASIQASFTMGYLANSFASRTLVRQRTGAQHLPRWNCLVVIILISAYYLCN